MVPRVFNRVGMSGLSELLFEYSLGLSVLWRKYGYVFHGLTGPHAARQTLLLVSAWSWNLERVFLRSSFVYFHLKGLAIWL